MKTFSTQDVGPAVARNLRELDATDTALAARVTTLEANTTPSAWVDVSSFNGTWTNLDAATFQRARYRKVGDIVYIQGLVKSGTSGTSVFTLPTGFRPPVALVFATDCASSAHARMDIEADGDVMVYAPSTTYVSLSCSFSTI